MSCNFGFKKVDEFVQFYKRILSDVDVEHIQIYAKAKKLAAFIGIDEAAPPIINQSNLSSFNQTVGISATN